jgi:hypothetical protein
VTKTRLKILPVLTREPYHERETPCSRSSFVQFCFDLFSKFNIWLLLVEQLYVHLQLYMPSKSNNICNRNRNINNSDFVMAFTEKKLLFLAIILNGIFLVYILKIEDETDKLDVSSSKYQQSSLFHHRHSTRKHDQKNPKTKPWTKKVKDTLVNLVNLLPKHLKHVKKPSEEINKQTLVKKPTKQ